MAFVEHARGRTRKVKGAIAPSQPSGVYLQTATQIFHAAWDRRALCLSIIAHVPFLKTYRNLGT